MTPNALAFDRWIRTAFVDMNTELEELYFGSGNPSQVTKADEEGASVARAHRGPTATVRRVSGMPAAGQDPIACSSIRP